MTIQPLAEAYATVCESPDPDRIYCYSPGLARLASGRLIATTDWGGPGVLELDGAKAEIPEAQRFWQGRVYTSDDQGQHWTLRATYPFMHARPFVAGDRLYILGHAGDLTIIRSDDEGESWSAPAQLTEGQVWHQAPCNVHITNGCVYLVMERRVRHDIHTWYVGELAPVMMRGPLNEDLTQREAWTFASELSFHDVVEDVETDPALDNFGVPFWSCPYPQGTFVAPGRNCAPVGWLETNVVQFVDPDHLWTDPKGRTFHLWMRAHTGGTGYACIAKVVEAGPEPGTGALTTGLQMAPSGKTLLYLPCPGGQMKFHVLYDEITTHYWLLSTQATDSMTRPERLPPNRFNLPNNQRRRLQLHFSTNMVDWCFAGLVAGGPVEHASRHYAAMIINGDDLHILSRSGDARAHSAHDGNLITFHDVRDFRQLLY
jgi:hypothetical protein